MFYISQYFFGVGLVWGGVGSVVLVKKVIQLIYHKGDREHRPPSRKTQIFSQNPAPSSRGKISGFAHALHCVESWMMAIVVELFTPLDNTRSQVLVTCVSRKASIFISFCLYKMGQFNNSSPSKLTFVFNMLPTMNFIHELT